MDLAPPAADRSPAVEPPVEEPQPPGRPVPILGGVAALLAARLDIDVLWTRIAFVLLSLVGGVGVLVYGAFWLAFIVGARPGRRWARLVGGALLVVGLPLILNGGLPFFDGPIAVLALLGGLAVALWQPRSATRRAAAAPITSGPAPGPTRPDGAGTVAETAQAVARRRLRRPRRTGPPSILGRLTLGIAVVAAAVGALIDQANGGRLHPEQWLGVAAIVCGVGLAVGAVAGRARWLALPALAFAGTAFVTGEAARIGLEPTALIADAHVEVGPGDPGGSRPREHVLLGDVQVDVLGAPAAPVTVDARVAVGDIDVRVAEGVTVQVRARADHGAVDVARVERGDGTYTLGPEGPPDVVVDARVGRGDIHIDQMGTPRVRPTTTLSTDPGRLTYLTDSVALSPTGNVVLADGEVVLGRDGTVISGSATRRGRVTVATTSIGEFQLLPDGWLLTPNRELLDLQARPPTLVPPEPPSGG